MPIVSNVSSILGSFLLGKLYERKTQLLKNQIRNPNKIDLCFLIVSLLQFLSMIWKHYSTTYSTITFTVFVIIIGFVAGGLYNNFDSNQILHTCGKDKRALDLYTTLVTALATFFIAFVQIAIGFCMNSVLQGQANEVVFLVLLLVTGITSFLFAIRYLRNR